MNIFTWIASVFQSIRHLFGKKSRTPIEAAKDYRGFGQETFQGKRNAWIRAMFHHPTAAKRGGLRHRPYTKSPMTGEPKWHRKMAAESRRINRRMQ
jgi:hypothetical protein